MNNIEISKKRISRVILNSSVPEDPLHAENTLEWLLKLDEHADQSLQIASLGHDIDRAVAERKIHRSDYDSYDSFKAAHGVNGAKILREILVQCGMEKSVNDEVCRLVGLHESGGDPRSDLLKDADGISFFDVNLPLYFKRETRKETMRRCIWGYRRLSKRAKAIARTVKYKNKELKDLLKEAIKKAEL